MSFNRDIYKNRKKSLLVKEIMEFANLSNTDVSNALGISMTYYNNKLSRNSFDFGEILIIVEMAGLNVTINDKDGNVWKDISLKNMYPEDSVTLQKVIEEKKQITEDKFKELGNQYIEELGAYKNSLNLYFVVFSKHKGKEWSGYAGYIFAKRKDDIEQLLKIQCNADVTIRSIESVDVQKGMILCGRRWITADGKLDSELGPKVYERRTR